VVKMFSAQEVKSILNDLKTNIYINAQNVGKPSFFDKSISLRFYIYIYIFQSSIG